MLLSSVLGCASFREADGVEPKDAAAVEPREAGSISPGDAATTTGDATTTTGDAASASTCPDGLILLGRFATLTGKVNVHSPKSSLDDDTGNLEHNDWYADPNCSSGSDRNDLAYCRRLWPESTRILGPFPADTILKPFFVAECAAPMTTTTGRDAFVCCGTN